MCRQPTAGQYADLIVVESCCFTPSLSSVPLTLQFKDAKLKFVAGSKRTVKGNMATLTNSSENGDIAGKASLRGTYRTVHPSGMDFNHQKGSNNIEESRGAVLSCHGINYDVFVKDKACGGHWRPKRILTNIE